jgi:hypothetical protein
MARPSIAILALVGVMSTTALAFAAQTESSSCVCATPFAMGESPLSHPEYVTDVTPYRVITIDKRRQTELQGATVRIAAVPGVTTEWLQRLVDESRSRSEGENSAWDPLALDRTTAEVRPSGDGFAIVIRSSDRDTAKEVLRRADALVMR